MKILASRNNGIPCITVEFKFEIAPTVYVGLQRYDKSQFEWGYKGEGPRSLAKSMATNALGHQPTESELDKMTNWVAMQPRTGWQIDNNTILLVTDS